jgi:uncharacterized phage-associated protein
MTYNPRKASQTVAFFALKTGNNAVNVLKAVKLVYLSDRENIANYGFPILDERRVCMKHGPVNSYTYDHIKGEVPPEHDGGWAEFVSDRAGHNVGLANDALKIDDLDELSDAELDTLESVWANYGHLDQWQLVEFTHDKAKIPEWIDPKSLGSKTITLESMLAAVGVPFHNEHAAEMESVGNATGFLKGL